MNIESLFRARADADPDGIAIVASSLGTDDRWSYERLSSTSRRIASELATRGVRPADPVLVFVPMSPQLYAVLGAIWQLGAVAMFLDPSAGRGHIERCCELVAPRAFVGTRAAHALRLVSRPLRRIPLQFTVGGGVPGAVDLIAASRAATLRDESAPASEQTPALITFTSGSTGQPKTAVRTHGFLLAQHAVLARHLDLQPGQVDLTTLPVFAVANLASGVTSVIPDADLRRPGAILAGPVVRQIMRLDITRTTASPALLEQLVAFCEPRDLQLSSLTRIDTGGAPVFPDQLDRLSAVAPNVAISAVYGSTEAEPIASVRLDELTPGSREQMRRGAGLLAGTPVAETEVRILIAEWGAPIAPLTSAGFAERCAAAGACGEIVVTGDHVLKGYLGGVGDEETKFEVDGVRWHRTGDAGYFDDDGRLWLLGRASAKISDAKGELWPFCVECAVSGFPGIRRTALASRNGRRVLVVQPLPSSEPDLAELRSRLQWALLDDVNVTRRIPVDKRHNAKVDYPALATLLDRELS